MEYLWVAVSNGGVNIFGKQPAQYGFLKVMNKGAAAMNSSDERFADRVDDIKAAVIKAIREVAEQFFRSPGDFAYEADLQCVLYAHLRQMLDGSKYRVKPFSENEKHCDDVFLRNFIGNNPVKCNYPDPPGGNGGRFDIVVLSRRLQTAQRRAGHQPPVAAIELKLWQDDGTGCKEGDVRDDCKKLDNTVSRMSSAVPGSFGVAIVFVHPFGAANDLFNEFAKKLGRPTELEIAFGNQPVTLVAVVPSKEESKAVAFSCPR